ncbi:zinc finger protein ZFP1 [Toxoplasma gondii RUB]|uniref:Zinc finger protein ZFP1 n=1 Tax=Toxoplasma gondii RUB TaxID=935652 RepID=A0A086M7C5_TOXGO|nr:zinc finger protein ZFP1 [Toxoplasma gondii RUB]
MEHRVKRSNRPRSKAGTACVSAPSGRPIPSAQQSNLVREIFWKTQLCPKLHSTGVCPRKDHCSFAHSQEELRTPPDLRCTKWCRRVFRGQICEDPGCPYAHSKEDLRCNGHQLLTFKTAMCKFHAKGVCLSGASCRFAHTAEELRGGPDEASTHSEDRLQDTSRGSISTSSEASGHDCRESAAAHVVTSAIQALQSLNKTNRKSPREANSEWQDEKGHSSVGLASWKKGEPEDEPLPSQSHNIASEKFHRGTHLKPRVGVGIHHHGHSQPPAGGHAGLATEREKPTVCVVEIHGRGPCEPGAFHVTNTALRKVPLNVESDTSRSSSLHQLRPQEPKMRASAWKETKTREGQSRRCGSVCGQQNEKQTTVPKAGLLTYKVTLSRGREILPLSGLDATPVHIVVGPREESALVSDESLRAADGVSASHPEKSFAKETASRSSSSDSRQSLNSSSLNPGAAPFIPTLLLGSSTQHGTQFGASSPLAGVGNLEAASSLSSVTPSLSAREKFLTHGANAPHSSRGSSVGGTGGIDLAKFLQDSMAAPLVSSQGQYRDEWLLREFRNEASATGTTSAKVSCNGISHRGTSGAGMNNTLFPGLPTAVAGVRGENQGAAALAALVAVSRLLSPPGNVPPVSGPSTTQKSPVAFFTSSHSGAPGDIPDQSRRVPGLAQETNSSNSNAWTTLVAALLAMAPHLGKGGAPPAAQTSVAYPSVPSQTPEPSSVFLQTRWVGSCGHPCAPNPTRPVRNLAGSGSRYVPPEPFSQQMQYCSSPEEASRNLPHRGVPFLPGGLSSVGQPSRPPAVRPLPSGFEASAALSACLSAVPVPSAPHPIQPYGQLKKFLGISPVNCHNGPPLRPHPSSSFPDPLAFANRHGSLSRHQEALFPAAVNSQSYDGACFRGRTDAGWCDTFSASSFSEALRAASPSRQTEHVKGPSAPLVRPTGDSEGNGLAVAQRGQNANHAVTASAFIDVPTSAVFLNDSQRTANQREAQAYHGRMTLSTDDGLGKEDLDVPSPFLTVTTEPGASLGSRGSFAAHEDLLSSVSGVDLEADASKGVLLFGDEREANSEIWANL